LTLIESEILNWDSTMPMDRGTSKRYFVYILSSATGVLYIGVTNDLIRRMCEHRMGMAGDFSKKYKTIRLLYYEITSHVLNAIAREKQIKSWRRKKKLDLVRTHNPTFRDLSSEFLNEHEPTA
jgi:putative endonuclease